MPVAEGIAVVRLPGALVRFEPPRREGVFVIITSVEPVVPTSSTVALRVAMPAPRSIAVHGIVRVAVEAARVTSEVIKAALPAISKAVIVGTAEAGIMSNHAGPPSDCRCKPDPRVDRAVRRKERSRLDLGSVTPPRDRKRFAGLLGAPLESPVSHPFLS